MNNLEKISSFLDGVCDIAFTPLQLSYIVEKDSQDINTSKIDYLWCYILISKDLAIKLQYKIQPDELEFLILNNEQIKLEPVQFKHKNLYLAKVNQEFWSFCENSSKNNREIKGILPLFISSSKRQFQEKFPNFLFECEMILKQKNALMKVIPKAHLTMSSKPTQSLGHLGQAITQSIYNKLKFPLSALNPTLKNSLLPILSPTQMELDALDNTNNIEVSQPKKERPNRLHKI